MKRKLILFYRENALALQILGILGLMACAVAFVAAIVMMAPDRSSSNDPDLSPEALLEQEPQGLPPERPLSLDGLLEEIFRAHGGQQAMERMQSLARRGSLNLPDGSRVSAFYLFQQPNMVSYTLGFPTYDLRISYDGNKGWRKVERRRGADVQVEELSTEDTRSLANDASINLPLSAALRDRSRLRWVADQTIGGREVYVVESRGDDQSVEERFYVDKHSFLLMKRERFSAPDTADGDSIHLVFELSDYREVNGARYPFRERVTRNGKFLNELITRELRVNPGVLREYFSLTR
ncbi:MAG: hypothetical protein JJU20_01105 [Opitutales bacterium]|nr:hypothetical protein [Opitutales bacterium]